MVGVSLVDWIWCIMFCWNVFIFDAIKLLYLEHLENALITKPTVSPVISRQINIYLSVFISTFLGLIVSIKEATIRHFRKHHRRTFTYLFSFHWKDKLMRDICTVNNPSLLIHWVILLCNRDFLGMAMKWLSSCETGFSYRSCLFCQNFPTLKLFKQSRLCLKHLKDWGDIKGSPCYCYLGHIAQELAKLPLCRNCLPSIRKVYLGLFTVVSSTPL